MGEIGESADDFCMHRDRYSRVSELGEATPEDIGAVAVYDEAGIAGPGDVVHPNRPLM
ncbi:hypothetical protein GCM10007269_31840 [Microbacterium murale]|uniref:Uncharacterized protein n=1 Tax=Microbacterium murale TaxID=1081040 RepID=A0ABQ1S1U5_9MICO|nr:hypothetical protein GCM10007269_31840 [Microbacterium murale]